MLVPKAARHPDLEAERRFWRFVDNRQRVYYRRFVRKMKPPWTKDEVLREFFFTNVYRELDRGSLYLTERILPRFKKPEDKLFNILIYRLFNHIPTYEWLQKNYPYALFLGGWKWKQIQRDLRKWRRDGNQVFTSAFTVTGSPFAGATDKITNICYLIDEIQKFLDDMDWADLIWNAPTMEDAWKLMLKVRGFGGFLAYEIVIDINYAHRKWGENKFVNPGPGCRRGINIIYPKAKLDLKRASADHIEVIKWLRSTQRFHLSKEFPYSKDVPQLLTLRNIEHSLCEFQKYEKRRLGMKGGRARGFTPQSKPLPKRKKG